MSAKGKSWHKLPVATPASWSAVDRADRLLASMPDRGTIELDPDAESALKAVRRGTLIGYRNTHAQRQLIALGLVRLERKNGLTVLA